MSEQRHHGRGVGKSGRRTPTAGKVGRPNSIQRASPRSATPSWPSPSRCWFSTSDCPTRSRRRMRPPGPAQSPGSAVRRLPSELRRHRGVVERPSPALRRAAPGRPPDPPFELRLPRGGGVPAVSDVRSRALLIPGDGNRSLRDDQCRHRSRDAVRCGGTPAGPVCWRPTWTPGNFGPSWPTPRRPRSSS